MTNCASRFCAEIVDAPKVFCDGHWAALPLELQEGCADAYKHPLHEYRQPNPAWASAVTRCIGFLVTRPKRSI